MWNRKVHIHADLHFARERAELLANNARAHAHEKRTRTHGRTVAHTGLGLYMCVLRWYMVSQLP